MSGDYDRERLGERPWKGEPLPTEIVDESKRRIAEGRGNVLDRFFVAYNKATTEGRKRFHRSLEIRDWWMPDSVRGMEG